MTGMRSDCKNILGGALAHLRGETSTIEQERFHSHMARCESCRDSVNDIWEMVDSTRHERFLPSQQERDGILAGLLEQIQFEESGPSKSRSEGVVVKPRVDRWVRLMVPLAAAAVLALVIVWRADENISGKNEETDTSLAEVLYTSSESALGEETSENAQGKSSMTLENRYLAAGLSVGVEPGSSFGFKESAKKLSLTMEKGSMWIQYSPGKKRRVLLIHGAGVDVHVVGTVLVVRVLPGEVMEVGVYEGKVLVKPDVGEPIALTSGHFRSKNGSVVKIDADLWQQATDWLDRFEDTNSATAKAEPTETGAKKSGEKDKGESNKVVRKDTPSQVEDLYLKADSEMSRGRYKDAAQILEQIISAHPMSGRADIARLDLARLYSDHLRKPSRAVYHLQMYLKRHPRGARAELVRERLCEIEQRSAIDVGMGCKVVRD